MTELAIRTRALRKVFKAPNSARGRAQGGGFTPPSAPSAAPAAARAAEIVALEALDLEVKAGEFFGLLGPNGAGKSTTIGILTTRVLPTSGEAFIAGRSVVEDSVAVRQRIGVVPQRANADSALTVVENLVFHAAYFGIARATAREAANRVLGELAIDHRRDAKVQSLSGGELQRLMIARALIHEPEVLFLDEPTVGLDPQARLALWEILRRLHGQGRTIVMTTHYMEEADRLCERIAIVDRGRLLALDTPRSLKASAPGGTLIELSLDGDAEPMASETRALAGVTRVECEREKLRAFGERGGESIPALIKCAERAGRAVLDIRLTTPSLETLFISLTGRKLD